MEQQNVDAQVVHGKPSMQAGFEILGGACPKCRHTIHVNAPGFILCQCGVLLKFIKADNGDST